MKNLFSTKWLICGLAFLTICCNNSQEEIKTIVKFWKNKRINFPEQVIFNNSRGDTAHLDYSGRKKIMCYIDSSGCTVCKLKTQLFRWAQFMNVVDNLSDYAIPFIFVIQANNVEHIQNMLEEYNFSYPVCYDTKGEFMALNKFPKQEGLCCFLLDEDDKVVLIGNPLFNEQVEKLYLETLANVFGVDLQYEGKKNDVIPINIGTFNVADTQKINYYIRNTSPVDMQIRNLNTSCECTSAILDKYVISPKDSAHMSINLKLEKPELFIREIYVDVVDRESIIINIKGEAMASISDVD